MITVIFCWYIFIVRRTQVPTLRTHTVSVGCHKHFCFKPLAHRSVKLPFSGRSVKAVVRSPCQAVTMTLTTNVCMCIYINECSVSLYPTVIKNIIKSDINSLFCLKI